MSNFKIQYTHLSSNIQNRLVKLPFAELNLLPPSMAVLTYEIQQLFQPIQQHFQSQTHFHLLTKAIKVLSNSLNHPNTFKKLQQIIQKHSADTSKMYQFICIWAQTAGSSLGIIQRLSPSLRKKVISIIYTFYFLRLNSNQSNIASELSLILQLSSTQQILPVLKKSFQAEGKPLSNAIAKCRSVKSQRSELNNLLNSFLQFAVDSAEKKVAEMVQRVQEHPQLLILAQEVPTISSILLKCIKRTINEENILQILDKNTFSTLTNPAVKEWFEEQTNYWKLVQKKFLNEVETKIKIVQLGKLISQQGIANRCLSVKYFYNYLEGNSFDFQREDQLISKINHQQWTEVYKGISYCQSFENFNLITLNISNGVKHWSMVDPFECKTNSKGLSKMVDYYKQFYDQVLKKYLTNNKKLSIAYSSFYVRPIGQQWKWVSFQQLKSFLDQAKSLENYSFTDQYPVFQKKTSLPVKEQNNKDHNIVVEAKLVRLLKRNKQNVSKEWLVGQSNYATQIVEAGLKRLCNKGIVELDEVKMIYNYIP